MSFSEYWSADDQCGGIRRTADIQLRERRAASEGAICSRYARSCGEPNSTPGTLHQLRAELQFQALNVLADGAEDTPSSDAASETLPVRARASNRKDLASVVTDL